MARTTPGTGIPVPESPDPRTITADLWASFSKVGQLITQTSGESSAALTTSQAAQTAASQALARALAIEDPIHVGPNPPTEGEELWVDTDEDAPPTPVSVSSEDITDATDVGRNILTAPLAINARNALDIWTGTRALLDAGTDEAERTWDAKELHEYVTDTVEADVTGLAARLAALEHDSGPRDITSLAGSNITSGNVYLRRSGKTVTLTVANVAPADTTAGSLTLFTIPAGFRRPARWDGYVPSGVDSGLQRIRSAYIFASGGFGVWATSTADRYRLDLTWITNDPPPATPPGTPA